MNGISDKINSVIQKIQNDVKNTISLSGKTGVYLRKGKLCRLNANIAEV